MPAYATLEGYIICQGDPPAGEPHVVVNGEIQSDYDLYIDGKIIPYTSKIEPKVFSIEHNDTFYSSFNEIIESVRSIMNSPNKFDLSSFYREKQMFDSLLKTGWNHIHYAGMREDFERQLNSKINVVAYVDLLSSMIAENIVPKDLEAKHRAYKLKQKKDLYTQANTNVLTALAMYVADNYQNKTNEQILDKFIAEFTANGEFEVSCTLVLIGCSIEWGTTLTIDNIYTIRNIDTLDIGMLERMERNFHSFGKVKGHDLYKQAVIVEYRAKMTPTEYLQDAYKKRFDLIQSIFLSSVCSVSEKLFKIDIRDSIFISPSIYSGINAGSEFHAQYGFTEQYPTYCEQLESTKIVELLKIVSKKPFYSSCVNKGEIEIALERYQTAVLRSKSNDSVVYYAVSCLEALFAENNNELNFRLGLTVSIFFDLIYSDEDNTLSNRIHNELKKCYPIRSKYAHGKKLEVLKEQTTLILEICRLSIIFHIQLNIHKKDLISKLEESMYSLKTRNELQKILSEQITKVSHSLE